MEGLDLAHSELLELWEAKQEEYQHHYDTQVFYRDAEQAESWIAFREGFLGNDDDELGVITIDSIPAMYGHAIMWLQYSIL